MYHPKYAESVIVILGLIKLFQNLFVLGKTSIKPSYFTATPNILLLGREE
jgi:hypothetical protein